MTNTSFYKWLIISTASLLIVISLLSLIKGFEQILPISLASLAFFVALNIIVFYLGVAAIKSPNHNLMTQLTMILVFFKLMSCLIIVIAYDQLYHPANDTYIIPFFLIYITYTVLEVTMLTKLNKQVPK
jgi:hypothetical protein